MLATSLTVKYFLTIQTLYFPLFNADVCTFRITILMLSFPVVQKVEDRLMIIVITLYLL